MYVLRANTVRSRPEAGLDSSGSNGVWFRSTEQEKGSSEQECSSTADQWLGRENWSRNAAMPKDEGV